jgi:hypothetical protein
MGRYVLSPGIFENCNDLNPGGGEYQLTDAIGLFSTRIPSGDSSIGENASIAVPKPGGFEPRHHGHGRSETRQIVLSALEEGECPIRSKA